MRFYILLLALLAGWRWRFWLALALLRFWLAGCFWRWLACLRSWLLLALALLRWLALVAFVRSAHIGASSRSTSWGAQVGVVAGRRSYGAMELWSYGAIELQKRRKWTSQLSQPKPSQPNPSPQTRQAHSLAPGRAARKRAGGELWKLWSCKAIELQSCKAAKAQNLCKPSQGAFKPTQANPISDKPTQAQARNW